MQAMRKQAAMMAFMAPSQNMGEEAIVQLISMAPWQMDHPLRTLIFSCRQPQYHGA